jgi:hypothetical protein
MTVQSPYGSPAAGQVRPEPPGPQGASPPEPEQYPWMFRDSPPNVWPVAVFTLFFGLLGLISTVRRSTRARAVGVGGGRYWVVFAGFLVVNVVISLIALAIAIPVYLNVLEGAMTKDLEGRIVSDSAKAAGGTSTAVASADCVPVSGMGDSRSERSYSCLITLTSGRSDTFTVVVDTNGRWSVPE